LYCAAGQPSFAISRASHLIEASSPSAHQGELASDEEGVSEDQNDDGHQAEHYLRRLCRFHTIHSSRATPTLRGRPLIRRITVPPFDALEPFLSRVAGADPATRGTVAEILDAVLARGDDAVREYTSRFDGVDLPPAEWELHCSAWQSALNRISPTLREALTRAVQRVSEYHQRQRDAGFHMAEPDGSLVGMKVMPLDRVGLYVPGGKASYPSSVVMNAVPAVVAGVQEIIAVVPPQGVTDAVLAACALSGVTRVFRIGGAQAIAALAYGTRTIPRVDKIVGPGNRWVA
jgi:histidinol dehydrogenase